MENFPRCEISGCRAEVSLANPSYCVGHLNSLNIAETCQDADEDTTAWKKAKKAYEKSRFPPGDPRNVEGYEKRNDQVVRPSHYNQGGIEVIDAITSWKLGYHEGNVVKYVARWRHKHADQKKKIEDLEKALFYLQHLIASERQGIDGTQDQED